uniref:E3 ubiquitin protein ligase n=1 Tax=Loa loa TaxID=7209 RepID=A0A1I7VZ64_LOALO
MRQNSAKQLEEEAAKMKQSMKMKQMIKEELYQSSKGMEARLELMLKQICDDNVKLHEHLWKIEETYGNGKVKRIEREKFQQELKKKLNDLLRKFKIEAISSNLKWSNDETIQYAIDNFEATIEIILQDKPSFHSLAERLSVFIEAKNKRNNERVDASLTSRIENMSDIITHIDRKKSNLHKIEEDLDYSIVLVKSLFDQRQVELERKEKSDRPNFDEESYKLREKYSQISHRYTKLEERMENIEKQYEELLYAKLDRDEQMYDIKSRHRKKVTSMS